MPKYFYFILYYREWEIFSETLIPLSFLTDFENDFFLQLYAISGFFFFFFYSINARKNPFFNQHTHFSFKPKISCLNFNFQLLFIIIIIILIEIDKPVTKFITKFVPVFLFRWLLWRMLFIQKKNKKIEPLLLLIFFVISGS